MAEPAFETHLHQRRFVLLCILGGIPALFLLCRDLFLLDGLVTGDVVIGRDFANVWTGGRAILEGRLDLVYDISAYNHFLQAAFDATLSRHNYSYPPLGLPLAAYFALFPYPLALLLWFGLTGGLFAVAARPWLRAVGLPGWAALLTSGALLNIWLGHYGLLIGALWLLGWAAVDKRPRLAGLCLGLVILKPHLGVLIPVILLLTRRHAVFGWATATVLALFGLSLLCFGLAPWQAYLTSTLFEQGTMIQAGSNLFGMLSTSAMTAILAMGGSWGLALAVQLGLALLALVMLVDIVRRGADIGDIGLFAATLTFLVLPYAFVYDLAVIPVAAVVLFRTRWTTASDLGKLGIAIGFTAPQFGLIAAVYGVYVTPFLLAGFALTQWTFYRSVPRAAPAANMAALA